MWEPLCQYGKVDKSLDGLWRCLLCVEDGENRWKFHCKSFISIIKICSYIKGAWQLNLCGKSKSTYFLGKEYRAMLVAKMELVRQECVYAWRLMSGMHLKKNNFESFLKHKCQNYEAWLVTSTAQCYIDQLFWLCVYLRDSTSNFRAETQRKIWEAVADIVSLIKKKEKSEVRIHNQCLTA